MRYLTFLLLGFSLAGLAKEPVSYGLSGAKLYVAPMEWNLDRFIAAEIQRQGLPIQMVTSPADADFVMTSLYQSLGSHMMSPGHNIQVKIVAAGSGKQVWFAEADDYALFFGRLRPHGPARVAGVIIRKLGRRISADSGHPPAVRSPQAPEPTALTQLAQSSRITDGASKN